MEENLGIFIVYIFLAMIWLAIWVMTVIHQAKRKKYWWIGFTILIQITLIIYWIVWIFSKDFRKNLSKTNGY